MNYDIATEYISYSQNAIKRYLQLILEHYFDQDIYDDLINAYINTRYYNLYPVVSEKFEENIVYYLKKSLQKVKDDVKFKDKAKYMFQMFKYILVFDGVVECDSARRIINEIKKVRIVYLKLVDSDFEAKLYNMLEKDLIAKKEFLESFEDKNFTMNCVKVKDQMFYCVLEHNLKFSKLYSDYAISKVFNSKSINEQKLFVTYPLAAVRALQDIIKGNFTKIYIVDYVFSLASKPKKNERLLKYINNDIIKEKLVLKLSYEDFLPNKEKVYELTRNGFKVALKIDKTFEFNEENIKLLKLFAFMVTDDEQIYDRVKVNYDIIYIPNS